MTRIPLAARLCPNEEEIDARTTAERVKRHFPKAVVDWKRGDEEVLRGVERLREMGVPEDWLEAKRKSLGTVAYVELDDERFPGLVGWFYASHIERDLGDCFDLYSAPDTDIAFLKRLAATIATKLNFSYLFSTESTSGIAMWCEPRRIDPLEFARDRLPERNYGQLTLRPLDDWQASLRNAVLLWFERSTHKSKQALKDRIGSEETVASEVIESLLQIERVRAAWLVDIAAPFSNSLVVEHEGWMSYVSLSGATKGLLA